MEQQDFLELLKNNELSIYLNKKNYHKNLTNIELFRIYINNFLLSNNYVCKKSCIVVRSIESKEDYITIEITASITSDNFSSSKEIESEIIEQCISVMNKFI